MGMAGAEVSVARGRLGFGAPRPVVDLGLFADFRCRTSCFVPIVGSSGVDLGLCWRGIVFRRTKPEINIHLEVPRVDYLGLCRHFLNIGALL